jgi:ATP-dependent helicase/nuclease subunit B
MHITCIDNSIEILYQQHFPIWGLIYFTTGQNLKGKSEMTRPKPLPSMIDIAIFEQALEDESGLIIVPNERLAHQICAAWSHIKQPDLTAWQSPNVHSMLSWLKSCWDEMHDLHIESVTPWAMAERAQRLYFWEKTINNFNPGMGPRFSRLADDTYSDLCSYCLHIEDVPGDTIDSQQFKLWCRHYIKLMEHNGFLHPETCWEFIKTNLRNKKLQTYRNLYLYGFQSIQPLQLEILNNAAEQCVLLDPFCVDIIERLDDANQNVRSLFQTRYNNIGNLSKARKIKFRDPEEELNAAAIWAADELQTNSHQRIGILIPDLPHRLDQVYRSIDSVLRAKNLEMPVNFSAGSPLSDTPLISGAIELLSSIANEQPLSFWLRLIYSPYSAFELLPLHAKSDIELQLRKRSRVSLTSQQFLYELETLKTSEDIGDAIMAFRALSTLGQDQSYRKITLLKFSDWSERFQVLLEKQNWPGAKTLSSYEYQQLNQWDQLIEKFRGLDNLGERINSSKALQVLISMANDHIFHEQTPDAPLQILGLLEASGLHFDKIWMLELDNKNFPQMPSINPLLPVSFQKKHALPRSDGARELFIARNLLQSFHANTDSLICSYPSQRDDEISIESPFLRDIDTSEDLESLKLAGNQMPHKDYHQCATIEFYEQPRVPLEIRKEHIKGGAAILRNQFICPFNSFAIHRLRAKPLEPPHQGINKRQRGILIHEILFTLWSKWKNSESLARLSDTEITSQINESIDLTFSRYDRFIDSLNGIRYRSLAKFQICRLIEEWLTKEKLREPFEVMALEQMFTIEFGELSLQLFVDRVDLVGDKILIIDYKTGGIKPRGWDPEHLKEPQLPLYVLACQPSPNGCAFAQLTINCVRLIGESDGLLSPELTEMEEWQTRISDWKTGLEKLASSFSSGDCEISINDLSAFKQQNFLFPLNRFIEKF